MNVQEEIEKAARGTEATTLTMRRNEGASPVR